MSINIRSCLQQAHTCGGVKPVNSIIFLSLLLIGSPVAMEIKIKIKNKKKPAQIRFLKNK
jgi:hypothetical protein